MSTLYSARSKSGASADRTPSAILTSVQGLRGAAALAVAAYHALQWEDGGFDVGRAGVDVFFVISGLVMWRSTQGRDVAPGAFLLRRLIRVAPLYWLATLMVLAIALVWPDFLPEVRPGWAHLALSMAFIPHLDPRGLPFPTLPPGWSLNYEAVFYTIFAAALAGRRRWRGRVALGGLTAVTAFGFLKPEPFYFLGANPMLLQFAAGMGLGLAAEHSRLPGPVTGTALLATGVGLLGLEQAMGVFTELWRPLLWGGPALLIVAGALGLEPTLRRMGTAQKTSSRVTAAVSRMGDASYAIYLMHLPATALVAHTLGYDRPWMFLPIALAASLLAGLGVHLWIERPLLARLKRWFRAI